MCQMSAEINELAKALAAAQGEMGHATKDAKNPHFRNDYATLASVLEATRPILSKHGLSITQPATNDEAGNVVVQTLVLHSSGQWMRSDLACKPQKSDAQGMGSVITYLRRYSWASVCGIAQDDDDAEAGGGRGAPAQGQNPEMAPAKRQAQKQPAKKEGPEDFWKRESLALRGKSMEDVADKLGRAVDAAPDQAALDKLLADNGQNMDAMPAELSQGITDKANAKTEAFNQGEAAA